MLILPYKPTFEQNYSFEGKLRHPEITILTDMLLLLEDCKTLFKPKIFALPGSHLPSFFINYGKVAYFGGSC